MTGKAAILLIALACVLAGAGLWYTQQHAFWAPVEGDVTLTLQNGDARRPLDASAVTAARSSSSPLGFRACFGHGEDLDAVVADAPPAGAPTVAPGWFDCFDAGAIAALIESGDARAFLAHRDAAYGIDRVVALTADGRGWAWHELNECGDRDYSGTPVGRECPDRDAFQPLRD